MPTYEYECKECNTKEEVLRGMKEEEVVPPCSSCGFKMTKVYSAFGINLKGPGFYSTDNRR
mgnify:CR=1 FL=1